MKHTKKSRVMILLICGTVIVTLGGCTFTSQTETTTAATAPSQSSGFQDKRNQGNQQRLSIIYGQVSFIEDYNLTLSLAEITTTDTPETTEESPSADAVSNIVNANLITHAATTFVNPFTLTGESQLITLSESTLIGTVNLETGEINSTAPFSDIIVGSYLQVQISSDGTIYAIVVMQFDANEKKSSIEAIPTDF